MDCINQENREHFEFIVNQIMEEQKAFGMAVAVVNDKGETLYEKCFGIQDREKNTPVNSDTIFGIASVSKSFTALSIMQMSEKGIIDLYAPVHKYLPEFKNEKITISHLLYHSAGYYPLPRILIDKVAEDMGLSQEKDGDFAYHHELAKRGEELVINRLNEQNDFIGNPGEYFSYCNDGFAVLTAIINRLGGENGFAEYVEKNILTPLEMSRSGCSFLLNKSHKNVSRLFKYVKGELIDMDNFLDTSFVLMGGGGLKSTLNDMKHYAQMYLNFGKYNGKSILSASKIREMTAPRILNGLNSYYGYALKMKPLHNIRVIEHGGSLPGVSSNFAFSFELGMGVVVLCNTSSVSVNTISDAAFSMMLGKKYKLDHFDDYDAITWDEEKIKSLVGEYPSGEGGSTTFTYEDGKIYMMSEEGNKREAIPVNKHSLAVKGKHSYSLIKILTRENGEIYAMSPGSRIVKKI